MTSKTDYTEEEWAALRRAPFVAGMAITLADPGGPIEATKETLATMRAVSTPGSDRELLIAVSQDVMAMTQQHQSPLGDLKLEGATAGVQILDELRKANGILSAKATPEEAEDFRAWVVAAAQASANAAKEGGFMGFGAELVSQGERTMIQQVGEAVGAGSAER